MTAVYSRLCVAGSLGWLFRRGLPQEVEGSTGQIRERSQEGQGEHDSRWWGWIPSTLVSL